MNKTSLLECDDEVREEGGFGFRRKRLGAAAGGTGLGASWFELQPGHQILNRSQAPLRFLALSTMKEPEVAVYPDSKKLGILGRSHGIVSVHRSDDAVDYYLDEK